MWACCIYLTDINGRQRIVGGHQAYGGIKLSSLSAPRLSPCLLAFSPLRLYLLVCGRGVSSIISIGVISMASSSMFRHHDGASFSPLSARTFCGPLSLTAPHRYAVTAR